MKFLFGFLILTFQFAIAGEVRLKVLAPANSFGGNVGVGSRVELDFVSLNQKHQGIFLGKMVGHPALGEEILVLDEPATKIFMIDAETVRSQVPKSRMQNIVSTIDQAGETCAAYAIYHLWLQAHLNGARGNGQLATAVSNEHARMKFLEEAITNYYMGNSYRIATTMRLFAKRFGFRCQEKVFNHANQAVEYVFKRAAQGKPVLMEFFIGPKMLRSSYEVVDFETKKMMDPNLWIPRKIGERNVGGHAITAAAAFISHGRPKALVLDSNWTEPRIWDLNKYLGERAAINEMIFHSCE